MTLTLLTHRKMTTPGDRLCSPTKHENPPRTACDGHAGVRFKSSLHASPHTTRMQRSPHGAWSTWLTATRDCCWNAGSGAGPEDSLQAPQSRAGRCLGDWDRDSTGAVGGVGQDLQVEALGPLVLPEGHFGIR